MFKMRARRQGGGDVGELCLYVEELMDTAYPACAGFTPQMKIVQQQPLSRCLI
jgi:hypothetical protein